MDKRKRNVTILILVLIAMGLWLGQMPVRRMLGHLDDLDDEIAQRESQLRQDNREIESDAKFVKNWKFMADFLKEPQGQRQLDMYLQQLQSISGIQITNFGPFSANQLEDHPEFLILGYDTLNLGCNLPSLVEFLARLDVEDQRLLRITRVCIERTFATPSAGPPAPSVALRYEPDLPGTDPTNLKVVMAISIPAAVPAAETVKGQEDRL